MENSDASIHVVQKCEDVVLLRKIFNSPIKSSCYTRFVFNFCSLSSTILNTAESSIWIVSEGSFMSAMIRITSIWCDIKTLQTIKIPQDQLSYSFSFFFMPLRPEQSIIQSKMMQIWWEIGKWLNGTENRKLRLLIISINSKLIKNIKYLTT